MNPVRNTRAMKKKSKISNGVKIIKSIEEMRDISNKIKQEGRSIGFIPTMGALHVGHLSLIQQAKKENDFVIVSIFVNPAQFGPKEDFRKYPRNLKLDAELCKKAGVNIIFSPKATPMYPNEYKTFVNVESLSEVLCGKFRAHHFRGVVTIVNKLFNIVNPDAAYFGQKDAQQSIIIKRMAQDLNMAVRIKVLPIIREADGLALSSRNKYLNHNERKDAPVLYQALLTAEKLITRKERSSAVVIRKMKQLIVQKKSAKVQYIEIVDAKNLSTLNRIKGKVLIALAVWIGKTRLVDNIIINI